MEKLEGMQRKLSQIKKILDVPSKKTQVEIVITDAVKDLAGVVEYLLEEKAKEDKSIE